MSTLAPGACGGLLPAPSSGFHPPALSPNMLRPIEQLRIDACRNAAYDHELEAIERELRRDLHFRGTSLSCVATLRGTGSELLPPSLSEPSARAFLLGANKSEVADRAKDSDDVGGKDEALIPSQSDVSVHASGKDDDVETARWAAADKSEVDYGAKDDEAVMPSLLQTSPPVLDDAVDEESEQWYVKSRQAWMLGREHCKLTTLENYADGLIQFEVRKLNDGETITVTGTKDEFEELCSRQSGLSGAAQSHAAISHLFRDACLTRSIDDSCNCAEMTRAPGNQTGATDRWQMMSQQAWLLGRENCTLTTLQNDDDGLVQFELRKLKSGEILTVTGTIVEFEELCNEQTGLYGVAQVNAAISQLFREASLKHDVEDFGEESEVTASRSTQPAPCIPRTGGVNLDEKWHMRSSQAWLLGREHCTLTILENSVDGLLQFEVRKLQTGQIIRSTGTKEDFEALCGEQTGLTGTAQTNAAISQLFRDAPPMPVAGQDKDIDEFGEDLETVTPASSKKALDTSESESSRKEHLWHIKSQQAWLLGQEHCTLTILENAVDALVQFEIRKIETGEVLVSTGTREDFEDICREQTGLTGAAQTNAAISQLFGLGFPMPAPSMEQKRSENQEKNEIEAFGQEDEDERRRGEQEVEDSIDSFGVSDPEESEFDDSAVEVVVRVMVGR